MMEGLAGVALEKLTRQPCYEACLCGHPEEDTPDSPKFERPLSQISDKKESQKLHKTAQAPSNDSGPRPPLTLTPGQTYLMPTGRYVHWCAVCGNLWRSGEALPVYCGHRSCHSPRWRMGTSSRER